MSRYKERVLRAMMCMTRQCWEDGIAAQALLEIGEEDLLELVVYDMVLRQSEDGRLCNVENTPAVTDSAFCVPATFAWANKRNLENYREAVDKNIQFFLKEAERGEDGTLYHMIHTKEVWADSAAYLPYALALTGHQKEAFVQMEGICNRLYDEKSGLYFHMWDDLENDYLRPLPWGVGNGWILTGLMRMLSVWGEEFPKEKEQLQKRFDELLKNLLNMKNKQGGFYDILDDCNTFEESETAAMIAYVLYRGIYEKWLDDSYMEVAEEIRSALCKKIESNGLVKDAASSPTFDRPGASVECQAHVLMMEYFRDNVRKS